MKQHEPSQPFSEDEQIEITDLPGRAGASQPAPFITRLLRRRAIRLLALLLLSILSLGLILSSSPGIQLPWAETSFSATPGSSNSHQIINLFYINPGPSWARLNIDGQQISDPPVIGLETPIKLALGLHHFSWQAAPFASQLCSISVPATFSDTCKAVETTLTPDQEPAWIVQFNASITTLPTNQRHALTLAVQQAMLQLQASEIVYPGEHFVDTRTQGDQFIGTARQKLIATLRLSLDINTSGNGFCSGGDNLGSCKLNQQDCELFCSQVSILPDTWSIIAVVETSWTYTTPSGQIIAEHMPDGLGSAAQIDHLLLVNIGWNGSQWSARVGQEFLNETGLLPYACASSADASAMDTSFGTSSWQNFDWHYLSDDHPAAGCLLFITPDTLRPSSTVSTPIAYLHRFGVSLALNRLAQAYAPQMPHPDAYELQLARHIAEQAHLSFET